MRARETAAAASPPSTEQSGSRYRLHVTRLRGHRDSVNDIAAVLLDSPTASSSSSSRLGRVLLASASDDGCARVWDVQAGRAVQAVTWRAAAPGRGCEEGTDGEARQEETKALPASVPVLCCAFDRLCPSSLLYTAHGSLIAVWGIGGRDWRGAGSPPAAPVLRIPLCCLSTRVGLDEEGDECEVNALHFSDDGQLLLAGDDSGRWLSWTIQRINTQQPFTSAADAAAAASPLPSSLSSSTPRSSGFAVGRCIHVSGGALAGLAVAATSDSELLSGPSPLFPCSFRCFSVLPVPHASLCSAVALCRWGGDGGGGGGGRSGSAHAVVASVGFDFQLRLATVDGSRLLAGADVRQLLAGCTAAEAGPLLNPPYPQCLTASPHSNTLLLGLGSGGLLWVAPSLASSSAKALQLRGCVSDAHLSAVVSVRYVGRSRGNGGNGNGNGGAVEYWASAGSDRRLALWRLQHGSSSSAGAAAASGARRSASGGRQRRRAVQRRQATHDSAAGAAQGEHGYPHPSAASLTAAASSPSLDCSPLDGLLPSLPSSAACAAVRLWSALHPVKLNAIDITTSRTTERTTEAQGRVNSSAVDGASDSGEGQLSALTLWAVGVNRIVYRYELQLG